MYIMFMSDKLFCKYSPYTGISSQPIQLCRDIFSQGIDDPKPEVQRLAQAGMVAYLATYKTVSEMCAIATVYTKNGDIYAAR